MDLLSIVRMMMRRWAVVVPVLILTLGAAFYLVGNRSTEYSMTGSYVLVSGEVVNPPAAEIEPDVATDALASQLVQPSVQRRLADQGLSSDYAVTVSESGSTMTVVVRAESDDVVLDTAVEMVEIARELLREGDEDGGGAVAATASVRSLTDLRSDANVVAEGEGDAQRYVLRLTLLVRTAPDVSGNPFPANLATVQSLTRLARSVELANGVEQDTELTDYSVTGESRDGPIIDITVTAKSAEAAQDGYRYVRDAVVEALDRLQTNSRVSEEYRTVVRWVVEPVDVEENPASVLRAVAGVVVLGGGLAVGLAALVETATFSERLRRAMSWAGGPRPAAEVSANGDGDTPRRDRKQRRHTTAAHDGDQLVNR